MLAVNGPRINSGLAIVEGLGYNLGAGALLSASRLIGIGVLRMSKQINWYYFRKG